MHNEQHRWLYVEKINEEKEHSQGILMCAITLSKYLAQHGPAPRRTQSRLCEQGHGSLLGLLGM